MTLKLTGEVVEVGMDCLADRAGNGNFVRIHRDELAGGQVVISGLTDDEARQFGRCFLQDVTLTLEAQS